MATQAQFTAIAAAMNADLDVLEGLGDPIVALFAGNGALTLEYKGHRFLDAKVPTVNVHKTTGGSGYGGATPTFNLSTKTYTWTYSWGTYTAQCTIGARRITFAVKLHNNTAVDIAGLMFRIDYIMPSTALTLPRIRHASVGPAVSTYSWAGGKMSLCGESNQIVVMIVPTSGVGAYSSLVTSSDEKQDYRAFSNPVPIGQDSPVYTVSLRFDESVDDINEKFRTAYPFQMPWTDNRVIVRWTDIDPAHNTPTNPNGWEFDGQWNWDVTTPEGLAIFRTAALNGAQHRLNRMNQVCTKTGGAQGVIMWQIEGNRKSGFAYLGDPRVVYTTAPEWLYETNGKRLIDEFFDVFKNAGKRIGVCLRPQIVNYDPVTNVMFTTNTQGINEAEDYIDKIQFAKNEWGATLFYIDSIDERDSGPLMEQVYAAHPDVLLLPEHSSVRAFRSASAHRTGGTTIFALDPQTRAVYPHAREFIALANIIPSDHAPYVAGVLAGDGYMMHAHYDTEPGYVACKQIYAQAGY